MDWGGPTLNNREFNEIEGRSDGGEYSYKDVPAGSHSYVIGNVSQTGRQVHIEDDLFCDNVSDMLCLIYTNRRNDGRFQEEKDDFCI